MKVVKGQHLCLQVGRDKAGAVRLTMMDRSMWQSLLETCCHTGRVATALQVQHRRSTSSCFVVHGTLHSHAAFA